MGVFSGMGGTRSTQGGNYIRPGNYLWQVARVKQQESQVGSRTFFIGELTVIESEATDEEVKPNAVGEDVSFVVEVPGDYPDLSLGNIKAFLGAAFGAQAALQGDDGPSDDEIDEALTDHAVSEDNPLAGIFVGGKAFHKKTKKGTNFTRINWSVPDNVAELAAAS